MRIVPGPKRSRSDQRGQILLMTTMGLIAMIGMLALVIDIGLGACPRII